ncbi:MAG: hypothetical protein OIN66_00655 [Candidatus Methanoperedens sp.]|nr:hypothetical protein [Candidatus Methanoperedens sp.]
MPKARRVMELQGRTRVVVENGKIMRVRENNPACGTLEYGGHADDALERSISLIGDCDAVLCSRVGGGAAGELLSRGIEPVEAPGFIEENTLAYARYRLKDS